MTHETTWFSLLLSSLALFVSRLVGSIVVRPVLGAASLPVVHPDDNQEASLAVANAIKPQETLGSLVTALLLAKPLGTGDVKVTASKPTSFDVNPAIVRMFPVAAADAAVFAGGALLGTLTRDLDPEKTPESQSVTAHTFVPVAGEEANPIVVAILAALAPPTLKPRRNLASLLNALSDAIDDIADLDVTMMFEFSQAGEGVLKVREEAQQGTGAGALANVNQEVVPDTAPAVPAIW